MTATVAPSEGWQAEYDAGDPNHMAVSTFCAGVAEQIIPFLHPNVVESTRAELEMLETDMRAQSMLDNGKIEPQVLADIVRSYNESTAFQTAGFDIRVYTSASGGSIVTTGVWRTNGADQSYVQSPVFVSGDPENVLDGQTTVDPGWIKALQIRLGKDIGHKITQALDPQLTAQRSALHMLHAGRHNARYALSTQIKAVGESSSYAMERLLATSRSDVQDYGASRACAVARALYDGSDGRGRDSKSIDNYVYAINPPSLPIPGELAARIIAWDSSARLAAALSTMEEL